MLGHGRLRHPELRLDDRGDLPRRTLAVCEQLEQPSPDGISENIERVHDNGISCAPYISQG